MKKHLFSHKFFAIVSVVLMFTGVFSLIAYLPPGTAGVSQSSPALSQVGETASVSIPVNYYTQSAAANSGTTSFYLPFKENVSQNSVSFSFPYTDYTLGASAAYTGSLSIGSYYYFGESGIGPINIILPEPTYAQYNPTSGVYTDYSDVGTVYANISVSGNSASWSHVFDASGQQSDSNNWIEISPSWVLGTGYPLSFSISFVITAPYDGSGYQFSNDYATYTYAGSGANSIISSTGSPSSQASQPFAYGWYFYSQSSSFTIPQYESSYELSWSSSSSSNPSYNGQSPSGTSGTFTGSLTDNSLTVSPVGDPPDVANGGSTYQFSYYLSSQEQVSSAQTTETASPAYTYVQTSGTTNEASASFSFSGTTPSGAVFISYETSQNSLSTSASTVGFSPALTVTNPYYNFAQNQLGISVSGASSGSTTSGGTQNPSYSPPAVSYTSSSSPSWAVSLNLYGNRHPVYDNSAVSLTTVNPLTPITLYANYTEYFTGETQYLQSQWNGHAYTSASSTANQLSQTAYFSSNGSKIITYYANNSPSPETNGLTSLSTSSGSYSVNVVPFILTPSPIDYTSVGSSVVLSLAFNSQTSALITGISLTINGVLENGFIPNRVSGKVSDNFTQFVAAPLLVTWQATDQYGYSQSITFQYGTNLTPSEYSNKITVLQSGSSTHSYPISLSGVPSGTGYYQQLLTIDNPAQYGINTAGSNVQFSASNGTLLYAWIQNISSNEMQVWVKNYNSSSTIDMQVLPEFENIFSASGHLGFNSTYFNAPAVFNGNAWNYQSNFSNWVYYGSVHESISGTQVNISFPADTNGDTWWLGYGNYVNGSVMREYVAFTNGSSLGAGFYGSGYSSGTVHNNSLFIMTQSLETSTSGEVIIGLHTGTVTSAAYMRVKYLFVVPPLAMPSFTIGTGSVFQANATTSSTFTGMTSGNYNATYTYQTYDIPLAPSTDYVTVIYNDSWTPANVFPSTYLPIIPSQDFVTLEDTTGFASVQVAFIEPSQLIGASTYQTVEYTMPLGIDAPPSYFTNVITVTPFGSSAQTTIRTTNQFVQLPYGSTLSITVLDPWGDSVGSRTNYVVANTSGAINVALNITELKFVFFNSTANFVYLAHDGINESFFNSAIVANGTTFAWSTSYYSVTSGIEQYKSGLVATDEPIQPLLIYLHAPVGELQVEVNAYSGSNIGTLSTSGNERVLAFIDGEPYTFGSTFSGFQGSTYTLRIATLLNQTLLQTDITLQSQFTSLTETITTPSYWMGIENDEQVPQNSPLATEFVSVNLTHNDSKYFNFTDSVGQNWQGYFLAGNYTVHMHDNVTNTFYINISKSNQQRYLNGQALLNLTEFEKKMNQLLNYTRSVQNTTYGLHVLAQNTVPSGLPNHPVYYQFGIYYNNYSAVNQSFLQNSSILMRITNSTGVLQNIAVSSSVSGNIYTVSFTPVQPSQYSVTILVSHGLYAGLDTVSLSVTQPSEGLLEAISIPSSVQARNATTGTILFSLTATGTTGSTTPDRNQTLSLMTNTTVEVLYNGKSAAGVLTLYYIQPGEIGFSVNISYVSTGYVIHATTAETYVSGQLVYFTGSSSPFAVVSYNPTSPPLSGLNGALYAVINNISLLLGIILGVGTLIYVIYRVLRKRQLKRQDRENRFKEIIQAIAIFKHIEKEWQLVFANIPSTITDQVESSVLYTKAKLEGFDYVISKRELEKIQKERNRGDVK